MPSKVLHIILDGCRPDALQSAHTPYLDSLWQGGAYSWAARSVMPSVTLPCHTSMFRGISPAQHGVRADNIYNPAASAFPSIVEVASLANLHTAMFYSWEQLRDLSNPGSLKFSHFRYADYGLDNDTPVAQAAADYLVAHQPDFCVLYLGDIDISGHLYGWMSPGYIEAIETNDRAVGIVLAALENAGLREAYTICVLADHGGHETDHGTDSPEDMTIPFILNGAGVKSGCQLESPISLLDVAPTLAHILNLKQPAVWEGHPVTEAFI